MALTKEQILSADDLPRVRVDVPEWAPSDTDPKESFVFVRTFSGTDREWYDNWLIANTLDDGKLDPNKVTNLAAMLCSLTICDEKGKRLFNEADIEALGAKNGAALERCYDTAKLRNGLSKKAIEAAEKNS
jgi:hypothetical protein